MGRLWLQVLTVVYVSASFQNGLLAYSQFRPDYKYHSEAQAWFKVHKVPTDWNEARLKCFFEGGHLASPINDRLYAVMRSLMLVQSGPVFTGVHSMDSAGDYYSMEGVPLLHMPIQWAKGEPNNLKNEERSLAILPDGTFADVHVNDMLPYICYKIKDSNETLSNECGTYAKGYELDPESGSCYKYHGDCVMWQRAHMICSAEGGHLLILNSEREAKFIFDRYSKKAINCNPNTVRHAAAFLHIGFTNLGVDRAFWFTLNGKRLEDSGYGRWATGEPNVLEEQCGAIGRDNSGLYDILCSEQVPFICEITDPKSVFLTN